MRLTTQTLTSANSQVSIRTACQTNVVSVCCLTVFCDAARREGYRDSHRGRGGKKTTKARSTHTIREQTPSTIQQTPNTLSTRLSVQPTEAGWTAGSDTLTSAEVAVGNNFDPLGELAASLPLHATKVSKLGSCQTAVIALQVVACS